MGFRDRTIAYSVSDKVYALVNELAQKHDVYAARIGAMSLYEYLSKELGPDWMQRYDVQPIEAKSVIRHPGGGAHGELREKAVALYKSGFPQRMVALRCGASASLVSQWCYGIERDEPNEEAADELDEWRREQQELKEERESDRLFYEHYGNLAEAIAESKRSRSPYPVVRAFKGMIEAYAYLSGESESRYDRGYNDAVWKLYDITFAVIADLPKKDVSQAL